MWRAGRRWDHGWTVVDQLVSSATSFVVAVLVARQVTVPAFGSFGVLFALYLVVLGVSRAWTSDPLAVRLAGAPGAIVTAAARACGGVALAVGIGAGAAVVAGEAAGWQHVSPATLALAAGLPGALLQDVLRVTLVVDGRSRAAALNDATWLVVTTGALLVVGDGLTTATALLCWGLGAAVAACVGLVQLGIAQVDGAAGWARQHRDLAWRYTVEHLSAVGSGYLLVAVIGAVAGLAAAGAVRGAQVLLGPLTVLFSAVVLAGVPDLARRRDDRPSVQRRSVTISAIFVVIWVVAGLGSLALPDSIGAKLLGDSWAPASALLPWYVAAWLGLAVSGGPVVGFRALGLANHSLAIRLTSSIVATVAVAVAASVGGARPAVAALAVVNAATAVVWWGRWRRECCRSAPAAVQATETSGLTS